MIFKCLFLLLTSKSITVGLSIVDLIQFWYVVLSGDTPLFSQARAAVNSALPPCTDVIHFSEAFTIDPGVDKLSLYNLKHKPFVIQ